MIKPTQKRSPRWWILTTNRLRLITLLIVSIIAALAIVQDYRSFELWAFLGLLITTLLDNQTQRR